MPMPGIEPQTSWITAEHSSAQLPAEAKGYCDRAPIRSARERTPEPPGDPTQFPIVGSFAGRALTRHPLPARLGAGRPPKPSDIARARVPSHGRHDGELMPIAGIEPVTYRITAERSFRSATGGGKGVLRSRAYPVCARAHPRASG